MSETESTHRKKVKHYNIPCHAHELTFSCYHRYNFLLDAAVCKIFLEEAVIAKNRYHFKIWAYVLMPNHVHLLIMPEREKYQTGKILQHIKGKTSQRYRKKYLPNHQKNMTHFV